MICHTPQCSGDSPRQSSGPVDVNAQVAHRNQAVCWPSGQFYLSCVTCRLKSWQMHVNRASVLWVTLFFWISNSLNYKYTEPLNDLSVYSIFKTAEITERNSSYLVIQCLEKATFKHNHSNLVIHATTTVVTTRPCGLKQTMTSYPVFQLYVIASHCFAH